MDREMKEYKEKVEAELKANYERIMKMTIEEIREEYEAGKREEAYND